MSHKWNAIKRVLAKYDAYTNHLVALSRDPSVKAVDKAKLMGYCTRWVDTKYILGCAVFVDVLSPCVLSKVMQYDHLDILAALLRSIKEIDKLSAMPVTQWPTYVSSAQQSLAILSISHNISKDLVQILLCKSL